MQTARNLTQLPDDFDVSLIGDDSTLPLKMLEPLRELAFRKAMASRIWFLENFWTVIDPMTMTEVPFVLRDYQLEDMEMIEEAMTMSRWRGVYGKARQIGATTEWGGAIMHDILGHRNHPWVIASQTEDDAKETMETRLKYPYLSLPAWFRARAPELTNNNTESMDFDNRSWVDSVPSTSKAGRGKVVFGVVLDEAAHMDNAAEVFTAMNYMCYGPLVAISTGNGMGNWFHATWVDSQTHDSEWHSMFHPWFVVPNRGPFEEKVDDNGNKYLTSKWYEREKRLARAEGQLWRFYQELPASPEEMFAKTGLAVLPLEHMRETQDFREPLYKIDLTMHWQSFKGMVEEDQDGQLESPPHMSPADESFDELWVWEPPTVERHPEKRYPLRDPNYVVFIDPSEGLPHGDRSSLVVFNANTMEQAASYRGYWPIEDMAELANLIGRWYHTALVVPERNNQGITVVNDLRRLFEYPRLYHMIPLATATEQRTPRYGWITSPGSKPKMVFDFIKAVKDEQIQLHDVRFLEEASTFIRTDKGGFAASGSNFDDHVMGHLGAWQGVLEVGRFPVVWRDEGTIQPITWKDMDEWDEEQGAEPDPLSQPIGGSAEPEQRSFSYIIV